MPRELFILRHAKSDWGTNAPNDFARPLAKRGKTDAPKVGGWLYREGLVPDLVVSSPAERARQTTRKLCKAMDYKEKRVVWDEEIYAASTAELLRVLARCPANTGSVMLVGHNPGLEDLLSFLVGDDLEIPPNGKLLPTAALARLEMPDDWSALEAGCAQLLSLQRPRDLSE
jgi:phosphohistidine phosphatase